ncbi:hypothetical protein KAJ02_12305 [Candidatus Bipolaricaulota bacterium]|nr:hypothetical protein [Candidatus Bipolaricaulota bacterium]
MNQENRETTVAPGPGPRGVGGIIVEVFRLYGRNLLMMVCISAVVTVPLIAAGLAAFGPDFMEMLLGETVERPLPSLPGGSIFGVAVYGALYTVGLLAVSGALSQAGAQGLVARAVSLGRAYEVVLKRLPSMLGASIIVGIVAGVPLGMGALLGADGSSVDFVLSVLAIVVGVYLAVRLMFAPLVALLEQQGPLMAVARSWRLVSSFWMRTFALLFVMALLLGLIQMPVLWLSAFVPGTDVFLFALVLTPLTALGNLLIYLDLRVRKDGYMTEHLAAELDALAGG